MSQSFGAREGTVQSATIDAVAETLTLDVKGAPAVAFWVASVDTLTGLTFVPEIQYEEGGPWLTSRMHVTNATAAATLIAVTDAISTLPVFGWIVQTSGASRVRFRASAVTTGSCVLKGKAVDAWVV